MPIIHTVLLQFGSAADAATVEDLCNQFFSLEEKCLHSKTNKPYVKFLGGGKNNSTEGLDKGYTHGFVMQFDSVADRDYYVSEDRAHIDFKEKLLGLMHTGEFKEAIVVDFEPGKLA